MNTVSRIAATFLASLLVLGLSVHAADLPKTIPIGAAAPDFSLPGVDGKTYALGDFAKVKVLVIVFTCNHCPTAQAYEDRIQRIAKDYRDKGVALVAISPNDPDALRLDELGYTDLSDSFDEMKQRAKDKSFDFPYLFDGATQAVSRSYGPVSTPHVFVFDQNRKLRYSGRVDDSEHENKVTTRDTRNAIDAVLAGTPVPVETTKTFGCSVKWSDKRPYVKTAFDRWAKEQVALQSADFDQIKALVKNDTTKYRLINVWATWCGPCVAEFPEFVTMNRMYRGREFELITISADSPGSTSQVLEFLKTNQASMKNYICAADDHYKLIEAIDPKWQGALPYTLLVAPGGEIVYRQNNAIDPLEIKKVIVSRIGRVYK